MAAPPEGWSALPHPEWFIGLVGPFLWRRGEDGALRYGFQSEARHGNPNGVVHGAALVAFADTIMGHAVVQAAGRRCATIALDVRFVAGAPAGTWVDGQVSLEHRSGGHAWLRAELRAEGRLLLAAGCIYRLFDAPARAVGEGATPGR
jgi:acyl-coenzyme A thioesterase PaaI-like protein